MTQHMPNPTPTLPPTELIHEMIGGQLPGLGPIQLMRMHFPSGRAPHAQILHQGQVWILEWFGQAAADRRDAETERLARMGQPDSLRWNAKAGVLLRRPGTDAKLPGLRLLFDKELAERCLTDIGLKGPFTIALVAHRLGRRAVLRIRHSDGTAYARLRSPTAQAAAAAIARHQSLWQAMSHNNDLRLPRPLGVDRALGLALYAALPGHPMQLRGLRGFSGIDATARALSALQQSRCDAPHWTAEDEIALLSQWEDRVITVFPDLGHKIQPKLLSIRNALRELPVMEPVTCHRDLHEGQILLFRGLAGLLDFDTLSRGDPAMDLGNLQAHLDLAGLRKDRSFSAYATAAERLFPQIKLSRIAVWRRAARLRLAMLWAFSGEPRANLSALLEDEV